MKAVILMVKSVIKNDTPPTDHAVFLIKLIKKKELDIILRIHLYIPRPSRYSRPNRTRCLPLRTMHLIFQERARVNHFNLHLVYCFDLSY